MNTICETKLAELELDRYGLLLKGTEKSISFTGVSNNSKQTMPGDLFVCKGFGFRPEYLYMAMERGAVCYMAESEIPGVPLPCLLVSDCRKAQSVLVRWFYGLEKLLYSPKPDKITNILTQIFPKIANTNHISKLKIFNFIYG